MKNEELKKLFKEEFEQKAPEGFTAQLMDKVTVASKEYEPLVPKPFLWFISLSLFAIVLIAIVSSPSQSIHLPIQSYLQTLSNFLYILILPMVILSLYFVKSILYYTKVNKL